MANSPDRIKALTLTGLTAILITVVFGKGCQVDVACVGCIRIVADQPVAEEVVEVLDVAAPTEPQVRADDNSLVDCNELVIPSYVPLKPISMIRQGDEVDVSKTVGHMALHIARQRANIQKYEQDVNTVIAEFNEYCK